MNTYFPEGELGKCPVNNAGAEEYIKSGTVAEALCVMCNGGHDLIVANGDFRGRIPRCEGAVGIDDGTTRDIALISRVNKPVQFRILGFEQDENGCNTAVLSRRLAQEECITNYISKLRCGDIIPAKVTHMEQFGAFVDIGCGLPSLVPIDMISVSRISHPSDRFTVGQNIYCAVRSIEENKITLTHKELLGTWQENADRYGIGETVTGIVRSIESYGIFVELAPNLAGLAELKPDIRVGCKVSVYIKAIIPDKMKIKLIIVDTFDSCKKEKPSDIDYFITSGRLESWKYSTAGAEKNIITDFCCQ
ncbi:MAG: 30S ribosomal protein S1 [Ruminiclostridium sp.]|nr:30S ribosomal protein S1 [Ruminiclostridium sp.]